MKKIISLALIATALLSGCSFFSVHKTDVVQGNIITERDVSRLSRGMSPEEVKAIMGNPVLTDLFTGDRMNYVYTFQTGIEQMQLKRLILVFNQRRLVSIQKDPNVT